MWLERSVAKISGLLRVPRLDNYILPLSYRTRRSMLSIEGRQLWRSFTGLIPPRILAVMRFNEEHETGY